MMFTPKLSSAPQGFHHNVLQWYHSSSQAPAHTKPWEIFKIANFYLLCNSDILSIQNLPIISASKNLQHHIKLVAIPRRLQLTILYKGWQAPPMSTTLLLKGTRSTETHTISYCNRYKASCSFTGENLTVFEMAHCRSCYSLY